MGFEFGSHSLFHPIFQTSEDYSAWRGCSRIPCSTWWMKFPAKVRWEKEPAAGVGRWKAHSAGHLEEPAQSREAHWSSWFSITSAHISHLRFLLHWVSTMKLHSNLQESNVISPAFSSYFCTKAVWVGGCKKAPPNPFQFWQRMGCRGYYKFYCLSRECLFFFSLKI